MQKRNKLIFLDIDGVLVIRRCLKMRIDYSKWLGHVQPFASECVEQLNRITDESGAEIVVSSTWRCGGDERFEHLKGYMKSQGVVANILGRTPRLFDGNVRGDEIQKWLNDNNAENANIVILDDDSDMVHLLPRLVKTDMVNGLTASHADRALELFHENHKG